MAKKVISFIGTTQLTETIYCLNDRECRTCFMAEAAVRFFAPDELLVVVTPEAKAKNFADLERRLGDVLHPQAIDIPAGKTEDELWTIFNALASVINDQDTIIFDVTNAFRSLPILAFLVISYIRVVRQATVEQVVYGAFEARKGDRTPVFDLTPFVRLLDWTTATDAFLKYGRADDLSALTTSLPEYQQLGSVLRSLTAALQTSRPSETLEQAHQLALTIAQAQPTSATYLARDSQAYQEVGQPDAGQSAAAARPFGLLLDRIAEEYSPLAHPHPTDPNLAREVVEKQLEIIDWYIDKRMFVQALTAAREWIVSLTLMYARESLFDKARRNQAEKLIRRERAPAFAEQVPDLDAIRAVWVQTTAARNSVAHFGWSLSTLSAQEIEDVARSVCPQLRTRKLHAPMQ